jgi:hypothetical protein
MATMAIAPNEHNSNRGNGTRAQLVGMFFFHTIERLILLFLQDETSVQGMTTT